MSHITGNNFNLNFIELLKNLKKISKSNINELLQKSKKSILETIYSNPIPSELKKNINGNKKFTQLIGLINKLKNINKNSKNINYSKESFNLLYKYLNFFLYSIKLILNDKDNQFGNLFISTINLFNSIHNFLISDDTAYLSNEEARKLFKRRTEIFTKIHTINKNNLKNTFNIKTICDLIKFYILSNIEYITDFTFAKYDKNTVNGIEEGEYNQYFQNIVSRIKNVKNENSNFTKKLKATIKLVNVNDINDKNPINLTKKNSIYAVFSSKTDCSKLKNNKDKKNIYLLPYPVLNANDCNSGFKKLFGYYYNKNGTFKLPNVKHEIIPSLIISKIIEKLYNSKRFDVSNENENEDIIEYINKNSETIFNNVMSGGNHYHIYCTYIQNGEVKFLKSFTINDITKWYTDNFDKFKNIEKDSTKYSLEEIIFDQDYNKLHEKKYNKRSFTNIDISTINNINRIILRYSIDEQHTYEVISEETTAQSIYTTMDNLKKGYTYNTIDNDISNEEREKLIKLIKNEPPQTLPPPIPNRPYEFTLYIFATSEQIRYFLSLNENKNIGNEIEYDIEFLFQKDSKLIKFVDNSNTSKIIKPNSESISTPEPDSKSETKLEPSSESISTPVPEPKKLLGLVLNNNNPFAKINLFNQAGGELTEYMKKLVQNKPFNNLDYGNNFKDLKFNIKFNINSDSNNQIIKIKFGDNLNSKTLINYGNGEHKIFNFVLNPYIFEKQQLPYLLLLCYFIKIKDSIKNENKNDWKKLLINFFVKSTKEKINKEINVSFISENLPENLPENVTLKLFSEYYDPNYLKNLETIYLEELSTKLLEDLNKSKINPRNISTKAFKKVEDRIDNLTNLFLVKSVLKVLEILKSPNDFKPKPINNNKYSLLFYAQNKN